VSCDAGIRGTHHTIVSVRDVDASLRFYRDGLGLEVIRDVQVYGEWPEVLDAPGRVLRAVFLCAGNTASSRSCVLELHAFPVNHAGEGPARSGDGERVMLSFLADVEPTLVRLTELGLGGTPRRVVQPTLGGDVSIAAVRDPDGVRVLLLSDSITQGMRTGA
jgi:catechol 2,3-dioxygenase-like lactoylglutathione lyase family enzyme